MFLEFVKVQEKEGLVDAIQHMDDWLCGLAKFVVRTSLLYDNAEVIEAMNKRKEALAKDVCPKGVRNLSCLSMKTMVNAVFKAVKERHGPSYVSTCTKRFPRFNLLMTEAGRRYGLHKINLCALKFTFNI